MSGAARAAALALAAAAAAAGVALDAGATALPASVLLPPGRYRLEMRMASRLEVPRLGPVDGATASISEARVVHDADGVRQRHRVCALWDATAARWGALEFPDAFVAALGHPRYDVALEPDADGALRYRADLGVERIGFVTDSGGTARPGPTALPTWAGDPRVRDWDTDGRPGATVRLRLSLVPDAEMWIVQHGRVVLDGTVVAPGRVQGSVRVLEFAQQVIGARPGFLRRTPRQTPDPQGSRFSLVHVGEGDGCVDLGGEPGRRVGPAP